MTRRSPRPWTADDTRTLRRLARHGLSFREIGERMDRHWSLIRDRSKRIDVDVVRVCVKRPWTAAEDKILRTRYANSTMDELKALLPGRGDSAIFNRANGYGLKKSREFMRRVHAVRIVNNHATRFKKGQAAWNKGLKGVMGLHPNSRQTQFKTGQLTGAAQHNYVPVGTERIRDGYLCRKVTDDPDVYPAARWVGLHRLVWEEANGPIPKGHAVAFRKGRHSTERDRITIDAVELVSRAELMRRNTRHNRYPPEVNRLIQLRGALTRKINRRSKELEHHE